MHNLQQIHYRRAIIGAIWSRPAALSLLASTVFLGHSACGQDAITAPPPPPAATNQPPTTLNPQPSTHPTELRLGPFDIQPRITTGVTYDDNILLSSQNPESDVIWSLQPAFLAVAGDRLAIEDYKRQYHNVVGFNPDTFIVRDQAEWPGGAFILDYGPRFNWFSTYDQNDSIDEFLNANLLWPMSKLILGARQQYQLENTTLIEAGQRTEQEIIATDLSSAYQFGEKTSAELNLHRTSTSYESPQFLGYTDWKADGWINYQLLPRLNTGAGAVFGFLDVQDQRSQTYEQFLARARYQFGERLSADLSVGGQVRQYESGRDQTVEPVFSLTGHYRPTETTAFSLSGYRREQAAVFLGANYLATGVSLSARQQILDQLFLRLGLDYYNFDYVANAETTVGGRTDNYFIARLGFEYRFSHQLIANAFYQFRTLDSNEYDGFNNNQVGVQLIFAY
jgi:hypothetical protein